MEVPLAIGVATLLALALLWRAARSAITVCVAEVRGGKISITEGGIAPRALADLADVVARPCVEHATLRIVRSRGRAELSVEGILSESQRQRVRNVVGSMPLAKLANARTRR